MLHTGVFHSVAAGLVGRYEGGDPKAEHILPDVSSAARPTGWQAHNLVSEWIFPHCGSVVVRRTVHDCALRWGGSRSRIAQDAQVAGATLSPNQAKDHKGYRHSRPRRARREPELAVRVDGCSSLRVGNDRPIPHAI